MTKTFHDDPLDDLLSAPINVTPAKQPPVSYRSPVEHAEPCRKCGGTGKFRSYSGRTVGDCFTCKGAGNLFFKTSPEQRERAKANIAVRRERDRAEAATLFEAAHPAEYAWLVAQSKAGNNFADSLLHGVIKYGSLTERQMAAVQKNLQPKPERETVAADVSKLEAAFAVARERAERTGQMGVFVKPLKLTADGVSVAISPGKPGSKWDGYLFVRDAKDDERKLGMFKGGRFMADRNASPAEQSAILACATDPHTAVVAYAKAWSRCGVCGHGLLNDVSIEAGMGPICRAKFGWA